ncbi:MAG: DUF5666 domain-containing protein [Gammaproteobacteria bacterium]
MNQFYRAFVYLLFVSLVACVPGQSNMRAGNDEDSDIGIGGTGMLADSGNGLGGTGIVGEITGFGSIFVNGVEIEYDHATPFTIDGIKASHQQLVIGDVVEVLTGDAGKHTDAQQINLRHEVIGKVETVNAEAARFKVLGQTVMIAYNGATLPQPGETVAVSGVRIDKHTIRATRVTPADSGQQLLRSGNALPYEKQANRWLVQTHVSNASAAFELDGARHAFAVQMKAGDATESRAAEAIVELKKNPAGELVLERYMNPSDTPQGRVWLDPVQRPNNQMQQRTAPMQMNMNPRPGMNRGG